MEWIKGLLDTVGSEIISAAIGLVIGGLGGGAIGYRISNKNKIRQKQTAKDNAIQSQVGNVTVVNNKEK